MRQFLVGTSIRNNCGRQDTTIAEHKAFSTMMAISKISFQSPASNSKR
jgi:hypothetical protein